MRRELLVELGTEEIPAGVAGPTVLRLAEDLADRLREARLEPGEVRTAVTARRLTVHVGGLLERQPDREVTFTGPKESVGLDADGNPTKAALGFLRGRGASPEDLRIVETPKGRVCAVTRMEEGRAAVDLLVEILAEATAKLRFPKSMRWPGSPLAFSRPIRSVVALLGEEVVPVEVAGLVAGRLTPGHPFLAPAGIELADPSFEGYLGRLRDEGRVIADADVRREAIREQVERLAGEAGGVCGVDVDLLEEVTFLVESPGALVGSFDEEFLEVPREVLVTAMKVHQRYFPVTGEDGALRARFVVVHNRGDDGTEAIRGGNERVLRARLADARFFWVQDRKTSLEERRTQVEDVLFHRKLGSLRAKTDRMAAIVTDLGEFVEASGAVTAARRAALLCKSDLVTDMVGEFPELQGVMGGHYARADGETAETAAAIGAQYFPRKKGEPVPEEPAAVLLALAEKLDNLTSFFSIGKEPKGGGDPFGLRRQAVGLLRLLREGSLTIPLDEAVSRAGCHAPVESTDVAERVLAFVRDRLRQMLLDAGRRYDLVDAAMASGFDDLPDLDRRIETLEALAERPDWADLVTVAERTHNIAKGVTGDLGEPVADLLVEPEEKALHAALVEHGAAVAAAVDGGEYEKAAGLWREAFAAPIHSFFERVFVNVEDEAVRGNRLALCRAVNLLMTERVADLSLVVISGEERDG